MRYNQLVENKIKRLIQPSGGGGGGATDLSYDASTRLLSSSTGADVTLPLATVSTAGLMSAADKAALDAGSSSDPRVTWRLL